MSKGIINESCSKCGQVSTGQTGEYPCSECGLPVLHDPQPESDAVKDFGAAVSKRDAAQSLANKIANGEVEPIEARAIAGYVEKLFMFLAEFVPMEVITEHALRNGMTGEGDPSVVSGMRPARVPPIPTFYA